jgi:hypothetical protein
LERFSVLDGTTITNVVFVYCAFSQAAKTGQRCPSVGGTNKPLLPIAGASQEGGQDGQEETDRVIAARDALQFGSAN